MVKRVIKGQRKRQRFRVGEGGRIWDVVVLIDVEQVGLPMQLVQNKLKYKDTDLSESAAATCWSRVGQRALDFQKIDV